MDLRFGAQSGAGVTPIFLQGWTAIGAEGGTPTPTRLLSQVRHDKRLASRDFP
jgi:hypothetical protein